MTWNDLCLKIDNLPEEQRETQVVIMMINSGKCVNVLDFVDDWAGEVGQRGINHAEGVLDYNHPYITVDWE